MITIFFHLWAQDSFDDPSMNRGGFTLMWQASPGYNVSSKFTLKESHNFLGHPCWTILLSSYTRSLQRLLPRSSILISRVGREVNNAFSQSRQALHFIEDQAAWQLSLLWGSDRRIYDLSSCQSGLQTERKKLDDTIRDVWLFEWRNSDFIAVKKTWFLLKTIICLCIW